MVLFVNESIERGIAHGLTSVPHCVLRQCFNRPVRSCSIMENMFMKVETKEYCFVYC